MTPESECFQYADDTTLYRTCKASQRHACINSIEKDIHSISRWSSDTNLIFNCVKLWSYQLHKCQDITNNVALERASEWKLPGITLDEHFQLDKHISELLQDCYSSLFMLKS